MIERIKNGISQAEVARQLQISRCGVQSILKKFHTSGSVNNLPRSGRPRKSNGGLCREIGDCFIVPIPNRSMKTLIPIISANILPGTTIISDQWRAYNVISTLPGITHEGINHSINFVDPITGANTQRIERMWKTAK